MRASRWILPAAALAAIACGKDPLTSSRGNDHLPPPTPAIQGGAPHTVLINGAAALAVDVTVSNPNSVHLYFARGGNCPLTLRLVPDSSSDRYGSAGACSSPSADWDDLAPGQSRIYTAVITGDSLTTTARPGIYAVDVGLMTKSVFAGGLVATVQLPLVLAK